MSSRKSKKEKAFDGFKKEFRRWQHLLQLDGYNVYFDFKNLGGKWSTIEMSEENKMATVSVDRKDILKAPKTTAKHEALHLLFNKLVALAKKRFADEDEIYEEWEKLVNVLEKVL